MAMDKAVLGAAILSAIDAYIAGVAEPKGDNLDRGDIFEAMADAIIKHLQSYAVITTTVTVTSVSGVTAGAGVSGPGTGTGTGTIA